MHGLRDQDRPADGLFAFCTDKDIAAVRRAGTEITVSAGTVIHARGLRAKWAYVILGGVAIATDGAVERRLVAGDVHGERALLACRESCDELVAHTDVRLLVIERAQVTALMGSRAAFAHGIARQLAS
jgi:CRP-like cAMP-binding protein